MKLKFIEHPLYRDAHPDEPEIDGKCTKCAIAADNKGRRFLLWQSNGVHWSLSRHDPNYGSDLRLGDISLQIKP